MDTFLYYCEDHREQTKQGPRPSTKAGVYPACPLCFRLMFYVPNGGQELPPEETK
jgi:hypothetical protein